MNPLFETLSKAQSGAFAPTPDPRWTDNGKLCHPRFEGLHDQKDAHKGPET